MNSIHCRRYVLLLGALLFAYAEHAHSGRPTPNIIVILADDLGYGDLSAYGGQIPTPNIDKLARDGMRFTDAHTPAAVCAPTRYSMLTGGNPYRNGDRQGTWSDSEPSAFYINDNAANQSKTMGQLLQSAGYTTSFFGKMHLGDAALSNHGFNETSGLLRGHQNSPYYFVDGAGNFQPINPAQPNTQTWQAGDYPNPDGSINKIPRTGPGDVNWDSSKVGDWLSQRAVDFVQANAPSNAPYMMYYSTQAIHTPLSPPAQFDGEAVLGSTGYGNRGDMIREKDLQVGRIIDAVEASGELDNTLFVFTADNGGFGASTSSSQGGPDHIHNGGLRGQKGTSYEGGHRVPFLVMWGDGTAEGSVISPGSTSDALVSVNDLMATFYDLTGQAMEADQAQDSASILPVLVGQSTEVRSSMYLQQNNDADSPDLAWRRDDSEGEWVLMIDGLTNAWNLQSTLTPLELYNLSADLTQTNNLVNDPAQTTRISEMLQDLQTYSASHNSPRSTPAIDYSIEVNQTPLPDAPDPPLDPAGVASAVLLYDGSDNAPFSSGGADGAASYDKVFSIGNAATGVFFDITLTVVPGGGDGMLEAANSGHLGVVGESNNALSFVSAAETLTFSISNITQTSGPDATIEFDGFTEIAPLFSADNSDAGEIVDVVSEAVLFAFDNGDGTVEISESTNDNPFIVDLAGSFPEQLMARTTMPTTGGDNRWRVNNLGVQFSITAIIAGDFDQDGDVDTDDLSQWQDDYGVNGNSDADGDGDTDANDFLIWQRNFGIGLPASAQAQAVPEPGSFSVSLVGAAIFYLTSNSRVLSFY